MKITIMALALIVVAQCAHPEKHSASVKKSGTPSRKESAQVHMALKTQKSLRMLKKKKGEDDECSSCGDEKKEAEAQKNQAGEIGSLKAEVLTLTTSNTELKTLTSQMQTELTTIEADVKTLKECCDKNKEAIKKDEAQEKKDEAQEKKDEAQEKKDEAQEKKEDQKVWDKNVNRFSKAKLLINYKTDWTVYKSTNYPMTKQNKALQPQGNVDSPTEFKNADKYGQFVGGTADNQKRMFSIVDMGERVQVSKIVYFANFNNMLFLTKLGVHYYTKDDEFNIDAPKAEDFKLLKEEQAVICKFENGVYVNPTSIEFEPVMARYFMMDLNNEEDKIGCRCCTVAGWKAYS